MPNINPTKNQNTNTDSTNIHEFKDISLWVLKIIFQVNKIHSVIYLIVSVLERLTILGWAFIFGKIIDWVINSASTSNWNNNDLLNIFLLMGGFAIFEQILNFFYAYSISILHMESKVKLNLLYVEKLSKLGIQTLEQPDVNDKMHRADSYLDSLVNHSIQLINVIADIFRMVFAFFVVFKINPFVSILLVIARIPRMLNDIKMRKKLYNFQFENTQNRRMAYLNVDKITSAQTITEVTIINAYNFLLSKFKTFNLWYLQINKDIQKEWRIKLSFFDILSKFVRNFAYVYLFFRALTKKITIGDVSFGIGAINTLQESVTSMFTNFSQLYENTVRYKDLYALFEMQPIVKEGKIEIDKLSRGPEIEFINVNFNYPNTEKFIFENLNVKIKSGEKIAIVGQNGAGKTTFAKLITRFYQATSGTILINNINIDDINSTSLYKNYGVLWQEFNKYEHLTVKENVTIGDTSVEVDDKKLLKALEAADALDFVNKYPSKYETVLSEKIKGGIRPSTGQWQKIAIARFFYRNAPLIIFDEPTASIDAQSEYNIFKNIYEFFTDKTVIIISHRFSTVRNADRILVMDGGKIVEDGTHTELLKLNGKYAHSFNLQAEGYKDNNDTI